MTPKQLYGMWKHQLGKYLFFKDRAYLEFVGRQYPGLDLHHLLKTTMGKKKATDYLIYPIPHEQHLGEVHSNIPAAFEKYYKPSIRLLVSYKNKLQNKPNIMTDEVINYTPEEFIKLVEEIRAIKS